MVEIFDQILCHSPNGYIVPEAGLTVADLTYFGFLNSIRSGFIDGLGPDLYEQYTNIKRHMEKIAAIPTIKAYYEDPSVSNPQNSPYYSVFSQSTSSSNGAK